MEHRAALEAVQTFGKDDFERRAQTDEWSVKDIFCHLAFWNWEAVKSIEQVVRGERPVMMLDVNFDEINRREAATRRNLPLHKVMDDFRRSQQALVSLVARMSESELTKETPHKSGDNKNANAAWIVGGIIEHYQEHYADLTGSVNKEQVNR